MRCKPWEIRPLMSLGAHLSNVFKILASFKISFLMGLIGLETAKNVVSNRQEGWWVSVKDCLNPIAHQGLVGKVKYTNMQICWHNGFVLREETMVCVYVGVAE